MYLAMSISEKFEFIVRIFKLLGFSSLSRHCVNRGLPEDLGTFQCARGRFILEGQGLAGCQGL